MDKHWFMVTISPVWHFHHLDESRMKKKKQVQTKKKKKTAVSIAKMCTREDKLAHYLGAPFIDDVMRHNTLITLALTLLGPPFTPSH